MISSIIISTPQQAGEGSDIFYSVVQPQRRRPELRFQKAYGRHYRFYPRPNCRTERGGRQQARVQRTATTAGIGNSHRRSSDHQE